MKSKILWLTFGALTAGLIIAAAQIPEASAKKARNGVCIRTLPAPANAAKPKARMEAFISERMAAGAQGFVSVQAGKNESGPVHLLCSH